jgi:thioredoxin 1
VNACLSSSSEGLQQAAKRVHMFGAAALCCAAVALLAVGCAPSVPLVEVNSSGGFQSEVLDAHQPVMMLFYKQGCAACAALEPTLGELAAEYKGRALFTKYPLMSFVFIPNNAELRDKYDVVWYPTVVLFIDGQERKRWVADYSAEHYRKELDQVVGPPIEASTQSG